MQSIRARVVYAVGGIALLAVAVAIRETPLAVVVGIGGVALVLYAAVGDRFESIGPSGAKFRALQNRAGRASADPATADAIARVTSLEELVDTLVARVNRKESSWERAQRVQADEAEREKQIKFGAIRPRR